MNILFLTMNDFKTVNEHGIYTDLLRLMRRKGHNVTVVAPLEKKNGEKTTLIKENGINVVKVKTGNLFNVGKITKLISRFMLRYHYDRAIKKYLNTDKIDLVLYSTPPTTLAPVVASIKKRYRCISYLMLKDIFPQNAVDLGMIKDGSIPHRVLRRFEKRLYLVSDWIGCMSPANVEYLKQMNPELSISRIGLCPNCFDYYDLRITKEERKAVRAKYGIPADKTVYIYGGNLGKPQGISFLIKCMPELQKINNSFFLIVGQGTEYGKIQNYIDQSNPSNIRLMGYMEKEDYGKVVAASDFGLIFLDNRFTIPNFPSRLLDYMQAGIPVLASTDNHTDIGKTITEGGFGLWCESKNVSDFIEMVKNASTVQFNQEDEMKYLKEHYSTERCYEFILEAVNPII